MTNPTLSTLQKLQAPIHISTRDGSRDKESGNLKQFKYIATEDIIDRLNEVFDLDWSFTIIREIVNGKEVAVLGCLSYPIDGTTHQKQQWGAKSITDSTGNALKSASALALTKCASMIGITIPDEDSPITESQKTEINRLLASIGKQPKPDEQLSKILYFDAIQIIEKLLSKAQKNIL